MRTPTRIYLCDPLAEFRVLVRVMFQDYDGIVLCGDGRPEPDLLQRVAACGADAVMVKIRLSSRQRDLQTAHGVRAALPTQVAVILWSSNLDDVLNAQECAELATHGVLTLHGPGEIRALPEAFQTFFDGLSSTTGLDQGRAI